MIVVGRLSSSDVGLTRVVRRLWLEECGGRAMAQKQMIGGDGRKRQSNDGHVAIRRQRFESGGRVRQFDSCG